MKCCQILGGSNINELFFLRVGRTRPALIVYLGGIKNRKGYSFTDEIKNIKKVFLLNVFRVISPSSGETEFLICKLLKMG